MPSCFPSLSSTFHCVDFIIRQALLMRPQQLQPYPLQLPAKCLQWKGSTVFPVVPGKVLGMTLTGWHAHPWTNHWGPGELNELIGQAWVRCLPVGSEARSAPPSPHGLREREEICREKSGGRARWKGGWVWSRPQSVTPVGDSKLLE